MSDQTQWYVMQEDQQLGPYTSEQLAEYAGNGSVTREMSVWAEGMENWLPAEQIEGLFPAAVQETAPAAIPATGVQNPYSPPSYGGDPAGPPGEYPPLTIASASFGLWIGTLIGGILLMFIPSLLVSMSLERGNDGAAMPIIAMGLMLVAVGLLIFNSILSYMYIYRAWTCLQPGGYARTTPGQAIGFMFIPLFNIYWAFQAIWGLSKDWNTTVESYPDLIHAPRMSPALFLCAMLIPLVNVVLIFIVMSQLCKGINFFAYRPRPHVAGSVGFTVR